MNITGFEFPLRRQPIAFDTTETKESFFIALEVTDSHTKSSFVVF